MRGVGCWRVARDDTQGFFDVVLGHRHRHASDGGAFVATIPAGEYYMSTAGDGSNDILAEFQSQMNSSGGGNWTVSISDGESGTYKEIGRAHV